MTRPVPDSASIRPPARWGLAGDIPWRMLSATAEACPWYLETFFNALWSGLIGLGARGPVGHLAANLQTLGIPRARYRAWRAIREFGSASLDGMRALKNQMPDWEVEGVEHVRAAESSGLPVVLWTAHMGSYDAAAAFFASRIGPGLFTVRRPEANPRLQEVREKALRALAHGRYTALYNDGPEDGLALELMRVLGQGAWVAVQADRALAGLSTFRVVADGLEWTLPKGPFFLPVAARATSLPVLVNRLGPRRYRVRFFPMIPPPAGRDREESTRRLAIQWTRLLVPTIREFPDQWLVFEHLVRPAPSAHVDP